MNAPASPTSTTAHTPPRRSATTRWYQQRSKIVVVGLIGLLVVAAAGFALGSGWMVLKLRASEPYAIAKSAALTDPRVTQALGQPIEPGWLVLGQIDESAGTAEMTFSLQGSRAQGGVRASVQRVDLTATPPVWKVTRMDIGVGDRDAGTVIVLVEPEADDTAATSSAP